MASASGEQSLDTDDQLLECAICMDKFIDPCVLPCSHTFCQQCLVRHYECSRLFTTDQGVDEKEVINCPACRQTWSLPADIRAERSPPSVTPGYQFNVTNESILHPESTDGEVAKAKERQAGPGVVRCDSCGSLLVEGEEKGEVETVTVADVPLTTGLRRCIDCCQNLCTNCVVTHGHLGATASHCVVPLPLRGDELHGWPCPTHADHTSDLFCWHCRQLVCASCTTSPEHRDHSCDDVISSAARLRTLLLRDVTSVDERRRQCDEQEAAVAADKEHWLSSVQAADSEIKAAADKLRALVERRCAALRAELGATKQLRLKQLQSRLEDVAQQRSQLGSLSKNIRAVVDDAMDLQLVVRAGNLHESAERCLTESTSCDSLHCRQAVAFVPSVARLWSSDDADSLLGRVQVTGEVKNTGTESRQTVRANVNPLSTISERTGHTRHQQQVATLYYRQLLATLNDNHLPVCGLVVVADRLFVCRSQSADVDVYDAARTTYRWQRSICVSGLTEPSDMAGTGGSGDVAATLFVSSESDGLVFVVTLMSSRAGDVHAHWSTDDRPYSVSLMGVEHLLVLSREAASVSVVDGNGRPLRRLRLPASVASPWSAVHLATSTSDAEGDLVVCHGDGHGRSVSTLDWSTGAVRRRYEWLHQPLPDRHPRCSAMHMVAESNDGGGLLLSDECCDVVQRVDSSLTSHLSLLQTPSQRDDESVVRQPRRLCVDAARQRLVIGLDDGRVKVFANGCVVM